MNILSTERLGHTFGDRWLFKELHFGLAKGDRVALVGRNGTGKSTLLKILSGVLGPNEGKVVTEKGIRTGYLPQNPDFEQYRNISDYIYNADNEKQNLIIQYESLLSANNASDEQKILKLTEDISSLDAWEYEYQIKNILSRLGITDLNQEIATLSGGQQKRLVLAKLLIEEPDIYILDEPTNHLDIETIEWLESLLTTGQKTVLLVTHDRYFLDNVVTEIRELELGSIFKYKGNYGYFLEKKFEREHNEEVEAVKSRNLLRKELEWMRRQPKARGTKSKSRIEAFYELEEKSKSAQKTDPLNLEVKVSRQGGNILSIDRVYKSFDNRTLITDFSYTFKKGDRIGLAGKNGTGKSTFLNLITGTILPDSGTAKIGETTVVGYYRQDGLRVDENERVLDIVKNVAEYITLEKGEVITASQLLTRFLFPPEKQFAKVNKLSGGEKKRLQLMRILMQNPNFLILDEPANDLDIDTLNVLEDFLIKYPGVLLLVSHDRYLLDKLTDQLFIFKGDGDVVIYNGNYADYKLEQDDLLKQEKEKSKVEKVNVDKVPPTKSKLSYKDQLEYQGLETEIAELENNIQEKTALLNTITDHVVLQEKAKELEQLNLLLDSKTDRWLTLGELV